MKRKALIVYTSMTNNTETIGRKFAEVFSAYGIEPTLAKLEPKFTGQVRTYYPEDYDFLCLGSPIIAALPYINFNSCVGDQNDYKDRNILLLRRESRAYKKRFGISFTTYGGTGAGPRECIATLEILSAYLRTYGHTPVGMFGTAGKELRHQSVDTLGEALAINIPEAQAMLGRFLEDPNAEEFKKMPPEMIDKLKKLSAVKDEESFGEMLFRQNDPLGIGKPGQRNWHYDMQIRPHERDRQKAKYFLENLIESYFLTIDGEPRTPDHVFKCIN